MQMPPAALAMPYSPAAMPGGGRPPLAIPGLGRPPLVIPGAGRPPVAMPAMPYSPLPSRPGQGSPVSSIARTIIGAFMLLTIVIPWVIAVMHHDTEVAFSWDMMRNAPVMVSVLFVMLWLIGAAVVATGLALRGLPESFAHAGAGAFGLLLIMILIGGVFEGLPFMPPALENMLTMLTVYGIFAVLWLIACHVRLGSGNMLPPRLAQAALAGITLLILLVFVIMAAASSGRHARYDDSFDHENTLLQVVSMVLVIVGAVATVGAYVISIIDAVPIKQLRPGLLTQVALCCVYATMAVNLLFAMVPMAVESKMESILPTLVLLVLFGGPVVLFISGSVDGILHLIRKYLTAPRPTAATAQAGGPAGPAHKPAGPSVDAQARLKQLKSLLGQGLISQTEFDEKRQRILQEL
jgi:hypothetical protein